MKKGVLFSLCALFTFVLGDLLVGRLTEGVMRCSEFRFARLYTGRVGGDVLVFGNSRAVNGFYAPLLSEQTGLRWVNLGYNGMGSELVEALILDYLDRYPKPTAIMLEVSNLIQGREGIRDYRLFSNRSPRLAELDRKENGRLGWLAAHCRTFAANGEILLRCLFYIGRTDQTWVNEGRMDPKQAERLRNEAGRRLEGAVLPESVSAMRRLIQELRRRNIQVCCVVAPYFLTQEDQRYAQQWLDMLKDKGGDEGVRFVSFVNAITDPQLYADPSHLNRTGSVAFTRIFLKSISGSTVFIPRLSESK